MTKAPKRIRPRAVPDSASCQVREFEVLLDIFWSRIGLTTAQIERLRFPSPRTAQRTMRRLLDRRLVKAHLQGGALHRHNVFTLTRLGADILNARDEPNARPTRMPRAQRLAHSLAIRDVGICAVLAAREGLIPLVGVRFEEDLAGEASFQLAHLLPDAVLEVRGSDERMAWIGVEVCLETEGESVLRKKITAWRAVFQRHRDLRGVLIVAQTERRVKLFRRLCSESGIAAIVTFGVTVDAAIRDSSFRELYAPPVRAERISAVAQVVDITSEAAVGDMAFIPL